MIIHDVEQRSEDWFAVRSGKFTASEFGDLMPSTRQGPNDWNKTQMSIIYRVAAERMTGQSIGDSYISEAMQYGIDKEAEARVAYILETGLEVQEVGFVEFDEWIGCSPDGLVGDDGGLEIKCPNSDTHLRYLFSPKVMLDDYKYQCIGGMLCTGRKWWDLYSFDDRFKDTGKQSVRVRVERNQPDIDALTTRLQAAIEKVKAILATMIVLEAKE